MNEHIFEDVFQRKISLKEIPKKFKMENRRIYLYAIRGNSDDCSLLTKTLNEIFLDSMEDFPSTDNEEVEDFKNFIVNFFKNELITASKLYGDNSIFIGFLETLPFEFRDSINFDINYQLQPVSSEKLDKKMQISLSPRVYDKVTTIKRNTNTTYSAVINGILDDVIE